MLNKVEALDPARCGPLPIRSNGHLHGRSALKLAERVIRTIRPLLLAYVHVRRACRLQLLEHEKSILGVVRTEDQLRLARPFDVWCQLLFLVSRPTK